MPLFGLNVYITKKQEDLWVVLLQATDGDNEAIFSRELEAAGPRMAEIKAFVWAREQGFLVREVEILAIYGPYRRLE